MSFLKILVTLLLVIDFSIYAQPLRSTDFVYTPPPLLADGIPVGSMKSVGIDSVKIIHLTKLILTDSFPNIHSLLIYKDDKLVYENYFSGNDQISGKNLGYKTHSREDLHDCRSISKSVVSACVGIAIKKDLIKSIDEPIFNYLNDYRKYKNDKNSKITIRHLLTMTSGLKWNERISYGNLKNNELRTNLSLRPVRYVLKRKVVTVPGEKWNYCGGNTLLLAAIIKKVSGKDVDQFAKENLFTPLGINKYTWLPLIMNHPIPAAFSGLRLTSRDMLKIGMLYLNDGKWKNLQILNNDWTTKSISNQVWRDSVEDKGYGYQFWTYSDSIGNTSLKIAEAKGNGGNSIFICKSLKLLVVITAGNYNQWNILNNSHRALVKYIIPSVSSVE